MVCKVILSKRSRQDIRRISDWIARDDEVAAVRFADELVSTALSLAAAPEMGKVMPERAGVRFLPHGQYLIIYRPNLRRRIVDVLRVWHGARGWRPLR